MISFVIAGTVIAFLGLCFIKGASRKPYPKMEVED